jgi:hypothetical protein
MGTVTRAPLPPPAALRRRLAAELLGSAFLAANLMFGQAVLLIRFLYPSLSPAQAAQAVVPHEDSGPDGGRAVTSRAAG